MWNDDSNQRVFVGIILASVVAHAAAVELVPSGPRTAMAAPLPPPPPVMVTMASLPPKAAPSPAPVAEPTAAPVRHVSRTQRRAARPAPPQNAPSAQATPITIEAPSAPAGDAVADFSDVTLTSPDGGVAVGG